MPRPYRARNDRLMATADALGVPYLPERATPEQLRDLDPGSLGALKGRLRDAERGVVSAMAPYEQTLREIRSRMAEVATETRRRERAAQVSQRAGVRELAKSGGMPSVNAVLAAAPSPFPDGTELSATRAFLTTGGEVRFGFATRPGAMTFTDGRRQKQARTWDEARQAFEDGWEPGNPGIPGVRVHLPNSRVERVVAADEVVVEISSTG